MSRIAVIGAGAWGTALAVSLANRGGHELSLWAHSPNHATELADTGENKRYLPGFILPADVLITSDLTAAVAGAEIILCVPPSQATRSIMQQIAPTLTPDQILLSASKGIEEKTFLRMSQVMSEFAPDNPIGTLGGPSFAQEVAAAMPTAITIALEDPLLGKAHAGRLQLQPPSASTATKTSPAPSSAAPSRTSSPSPPASSPASNFGQNATAALITRGIAEITRLAVACGGRRDTMSGLSGIGDLVLTCTGGLSRNRTVGVELGRGHKLPEIIAGLNGKVAEGVRSTTAALGLAARYGVEMPITEQMAAILHHDKAPRDAIRDLMSRPGRTE